MVRTRFTFLLITLLLSLSSALHAFDPNCKTKLLYKNLVLLENLKTGHLAKDPDKYTAVIAHKTQVLNGLEYEGIIPWGPRKRDAVKRFMIEKFGVDKWAQELPPYDKNQKLGKQTIDIQEIRFSQVNARNMSQDGKYSVIDNAKSFKDGTLTVDKLPAIRVWRDTEGRIWTLDHRRLAAMRLSGVINEVPVEFVDEATVQAQKFKFGTHNDGRSLFVWMDDHKSEDLAIVIVNKAQDVGSRAKQAAVITAKEFVQDDRKAQVVEKVMGTKSKGSVSAVSSDVAGNLKTGRLADLTKHEQLMYKTEQEIIHLNHQGVLPWGPNPIDAAKRFAIEKLGMSVFGKKLPQFSKAQKLGKAEVKVDDIRFSQIRCRNSSQDGKYTVLQNAKDLQEGKLKVEQLPTLRVWRDTDGRIWTLDHRRLAAIRLAGNIENITVEFVDEATVIAQKFKFDTLTEGKSMLVWLDNSKESTDLSVLIAPKNLNRSSAGSKAGTK